MLENGGGDTIVCRVFLAGDELLGVEELSVGTGPDLIEHRGLQVDVHGSRNVLAVACHQPCHRDCVVVPVSEKNVLMEPFSW
jgi:hypothetical protein